jgi:hypothetical protein
MKASATLDGLTSDISCMVYTPQLNHTGDG